MTWSNPKFAHKDGERIVIDVRRAALAGAREIEVFFREETNSIECVIRKTKEKP